MLSSGVKLRALLDNTSVPGNAWASTTSTQGSESEWGPASSRLSVSSSVRISGFRSSPGGGVRGVGSGRCDGGVESCDLVADVWEVPF